MRVPGGGLFRWAVLALCLPAAGSAAGLGGEHLVTDKWRQVHSDLSPLTNPAFVVQGNHPYLRYTASRTLREFALHELGVNVPVALYQGLGATWLYRGTQDYAQTVFDEATQTQQKVGTITDRTNAFYLTYGVNPFGRVDVGVNLHLDYQHFAEERDLGVGVDAGLAYRLRYNPVLGYHVLGLSMSNLVSPAIGSGYPRTLTTSWHGEVAEDRVEGGLWFRLPDLGAIWKEPHAASGDTAAVTVSPEWTLGGKLGVWLFRFVKAYGLGGIDNHGMDHVGFAAGIDFPRANRGREVEALFQYVRLEQGASSYSVYVHAEFGDHREQRYARRRAVLLNTAPTEMFNRALALYRRGKYWEAYFAFGEVATAFPGFYKIDWVDYYSAHCLEELDMRKAAAKAYRQARAENPKSTVVPRCDLGLMRIRYRQHDRAGVHQGFKALDRAEVSDTIRYDAYYLWGQSNMREGNFSLARQVFERIPEWHRQYAFAQYSLAVAYEHLGNPRGTKIALSRSAGVTPRNEVEEQIANKSRVQLGYLFLEDLTGEQNSLSKAVSVLRRVPQSSIYYPDALLGLGWAAMRARNWHDCIDMGSALAEATDQDMLKAEGGLIEGYGHFSLQDYHAAVKVLEEAWDALERLEANPRMPDARVQGIRAEYDSIAASAVHLSRTSRSAHVESMVTELHDRQQELHRKLADTALKADRFSRHGLFMIRFDAVKEDIGFLLARATELSSTEQYDKLRQKTREKTEEIDEEIEKLRDEIQELE